MRNKRLTSVLSLVLLAAGATCAMAAGAEDEFKAAYAAAEAANKEAGKLRNQWTTTASTLAAAKKSADAGDFDKATASAKEAEAWPRRRSSRPPARRPAGRKWKYARA